MIEKMSNFSLYTSLKNNLPNKDLSLVQKKELLKHISSMDTEAHELIYALIKCFYIEEKGDIVTVPYNIEIHKDKIDIDLLDLPYLLRQILYKFVTIHNRKIVEDEQIKEFQK